MKTYKCIPSLNSLHIEDEYLPSVKTEILSRIMAGMIESGRLLVGCMSKVQQPKKKYRKLGKKFC